MNNIRNLFFILIFSSFSLISCQKYYSDNIFKNIATGYVEKVQKYISLGRDISVKDDNGNTLLMHAISSGQTEIAKLLLDTSIDINERNNQGISALMLATQKNNTTLVDLLIEKNVYINAKDNGNFSPLMFASEMGYPEIVKKLLDSGAKIDEKNLNGETPLILSVKNNHQEVVQLLLEHSPKKNYEALYIAAERGFLPILKELLGNQYNSPQKITEALLKACASNIDSPETIRELAKQGANVNVINSEKRTPLMIAVKKQKLQSVIELISLGADVNSKNIEYEIGNPLLLACENNNLLIIKELLKAGADIEATYPNKTSPLMVAILGGNIEMVETLIKAGANVNTKNNYGVSPLMIAAEKDIGLVNVLIDAGARTNEKDNNKETALIYAIKNNNIPIVQELLKQGVSVNSKHKDNETPLMYATRKNNKELLHTLIILNANIEAQNGQGQTALDIAQENKYEEAEKELLNAGAVNKKDSDTKIRLDPDVFPIKKNIPTADKNFGLSTQKSVQYRNIQLQDSITIDIPKGWEVLSAKKIEDIKNFSQQLTNISDPSRSQILGVDSDPKGAQIRLSISREGLSGEMLNQVTTEELKYAGIEYKNAMNSLSKKLNIKILDTPQIYKTKWKGLNCGIISYTRSDPKDPNGKWKVIQQHIPFRGKNLTFTLSYKLNIPREKQFKEILNHVKDSLTIN